MNIWAHRGCSQKYPENTITAFSKALQVKGLTGIELDIQMTKDNEIVVIHDEQVNRTTDGIGYVKDFTYSQLRQLAIDTGEGKKERIPSVIDVLDLMQKEMKTGLLLNIELKNSNILYEKIEDKILDLIAVRSLQDQVIYSSFYTKSLKRIKELEPKAAIGVLDTKVSECFYKRNGCFGINDSIALHPFWKGIDFTKEQLNGQTVRAWFAGHLFPEKPTGTRLDVNKMENMGITDVFLNEPEVYLDA